MLRYTFLKCENLRNKTIEVLFHQVIELFQNLITIKSTAKGGTGKINLEGWKEN